MASWKEKKFSPEKILPILDEAKIVAQDGRISFHAQQYSQAIVILDSMIDMDKEIPNKAKQEILEKSVSQAANRKRITKKILMNAINKFETEYKKLNIQSFRLVTHISISSTCRVPKVDIRGSTITVNPKLYSNCRQAREQLIEQYKKCIYGELPQDYSIVSATVHARSEVEAMEMALDSLDLLRGIWNLSRNKGESIFFHKLPTTRSPVNKIVLHPIHTLHRFDGKAATSMVWYEPKYQGPVATWGDTGEFDRMLAYFKGFRSFMMKSYYRSEIEQSIIRYCRALDERDWEASFLSLWSVLELLTDTLRSSYDVTAKRASFHFNEREISREVLKHLAEVRNRSVHAGHQSEYMNSVLYQLKDIVEVLIEFHTLSTFRFRSIAEAASFMDLPHEIVDLADRIGDLDRKLEVLAYAKRYRT